MESRGWRAMEGERAMDGEPFGESHGGGDDGGEPRKGGAGGGGADVPAAERREPGRGSGEKPGRGGYRGSSQPLTKSPQARGFRRLSQVERRAGR